MYAVIEEFTSKNFMINTIKCIGPISAYTSDQIVLI